LIRGTTVVEALAAAVDDHPDREAFVDGEHRLTYAGWRDAALGLASELAAQGVDKGDVVCLMMPSSIDFAIAYMAAIHLGAITSAINPRLGAAEQQSILDRTEPKATITPATPLRDWTRTAHRERFVSNLSETDPVAVVWTSGTTGAPKGAVFDHSNLRAVAAGAGPLSAPGDRKLSPLPFAHVGFMTKIWDEIAHGSTTIITPTPWRAADAVRLMETERVTVGQGVPAQWRLVLDHLKDHPAGTSSLRIAATGAAPVPPELVHEMHDRLGVPVLVRYASTEAAIIAGTDPDDEVDVVARCVGRASPGVELRIDDESGIRLRSAAMMRGYWADPGRTAAVFDADGFLVTGDLGRIDDDGRLTLLGRRTEMYIRGGYNVYPLEVEAVLSAHPAVGRVAVVSVPDPVLGEIGIAFVIAAEGAPPGTDELRTWVRDRLADYKAPDKVVIVDELPLTPMMKIDKRALALEESNR
jgi:acyl-CoA synthetase (AMP-forming)/AMP-acid ligase II